MFVSIIVLTVGGIWMLVWPPDNLMIPLILVVVCIASRFVVHFFARRGPLIKPPAPNPGGPPR